MRVLLTTHQFFPDYSAGTEVLTYSVAKDLIRRGHEVHVFTGFPGAVDIPDDARFDEYDYDGVHVYRFHHAYTPMGKQISMIEIGYDNHLAASRFSEIVADFDPDLVHFFHLNRLGTGLIDFAVASGVPGFMTPTDFWTICPTAQLLLEDGALCEGPSMYSGNCLKHFAQATQTGVFSKLGEYLPVAGADLVAKLTEKIWLPSYPKKHEVLAITKRLTVNVSRLNCLKKIIAPNAFMKDVLVRYGVAPDIISISGFGVNPSFQESQVRIVCNGVLRIAFIGTLGNHKGCHVLIEAFKQLPENVATLKIYGRLDEFPDYLNKLKGLAEGVRSIEFCGVFPNSKIADIFADIDVLVVPSLWYENTPLVIYSAQAAHCPVVASNLPGLADAVHHEENGLLFVPGDSGDLANQLTRLLEETGLLQRLSADFVAPKTITSYVDELLEVWQAAG